MKLKAFGISDVGKKRFRNEDSFLVNVDLSLFLVADGMGGHRGGQLASALAASTIEDVMKNLHSDPEATVISGVNEDESDYVDRLRYAIEVASSKIFDRAAYDDSLKGMGTTVVMATFSDGKVHIAHVGDSRAYLIHANKIKRLTIDHSLVAEQFEAGLIAADEVRKHRLKNVITRSVGYQQEVIPDLISEEIHMGDKLILCSDGLTNHLEDQEICDLVVNSQSPEQGCQQLIDLALKNGGDDNVTVVIAEVLDPAD